MTERLSMTTSVQPPDFERLFNAINAQYIAVDPDLRVVAATDSFLAATLKERASSVGKHILEVFPDNPDDPTANGTEVLRGSLKEVLHTGQSLVLAPQRYDMKRSDGTYEERYWQPHNEPVFDDDGNVIYVLHGAEDVTAQTLSERNS